jgi:hypothetical protein
VKLLVGDRVRVKSEKWAGSPYGYIYTKVGSIGVIESMHSDKGDIATIRWEKLTGEQVTGLDCYQCGLNVNDLELYNPEPKSKWRRIVL